MDSIKTYCTSKWCDPKQEEGVKKLVPAGTYFCPDCKQLLIQKPILKPKVENIKRIDKYSHYTY